MPPFVASLTNRLATVYVFAPRRVVVRPRRRVSSRGHRHHGLELGRHRPEGGVRPVPTQNSESQEILEFFRHSEF